MKCEICKKEFEIGRLMIHVKKVHNIIPEVYYCTYIESISESPICPICNQSRKFAGFKDGYFATCGNRTCSAKLANLRGKEKQIQGCKKRNQKWKEEIDPETGLSKQQLIVKKGEEKRSEIREETLKKQSVSMKKRDEDGLTQIERTMLEKHGVKNAMELENVKKKVSEKVKDKMPQTLEKMKETCLEKFGVDNFTKTIECKKINAKYTREKVKPRILVYFQENNLTLTSNIDDYVNQNEPLEFICNSCNNTYKKSWWDIRYWWKCRYCNKDKSSHETEIKEFLITNQITFLKDTRDIIFNPKTGRGFELDFYIPSLKIAIEFDGLWYHCALNGNCDEYHFEKTELCEKKGIKLIHIFEDEWIFKKDIVKSRLKNILKIPSVSTIFARNCCVKKVDYKEKENFLIENHLQENCPTYVNLGLYYNDKLISLMTFSRSNITKGFKKQEGIWELSRFCNKVNFHIPGAASKLFEYFKSHYNWIKIQTQADRRWSSSINNLYKSLGFKFIGVTEITRYYLHPSRCLKRYHRFNFLRKDLEKLEKYDKNASRYENLISNGYTTIHDCGHLKFELLKTK